MSRCFCFIPAKSNSERLPNKNNLELNGHPLYYYPIQCALKSHLFLEDDVIFSSENDLMNQRASSYGASIPFVRPIELTKNHIGIVDVLLHFLNEMPKYKDYDYAFIGLSTAPFTRPMDYDNSLKIIERKKANTLLSVTKNSNSIFQSMNLKDELLYPVFKDTFKTKQENSAYDTYHPNGCVHIIKIKTLLENKKYVVSPICAYEMDAHLGIDIDSKADYDFARFLLSQNLIDLSWI